jgi:subtilisin family serine protease
MMTQPGSPEPAEAVTVSKRINPDQTIKDQVDNIKSAFDEQGITLKADVVNGSVRYISDAQHLLVLEKYLDRVRNVLGLSAEQRYVEPVVDGVVLLTLVPARQGQQLDDLDILIDRVEKHLGVDVVAPDHLYTVANQTAEIGPCPATEPQEAYYRTEPFPSVSPGDGGAGVRIYVADTGVLPEVGQSPWLREHPWMRGVHGDTDDPLTSSNLIKPYAGHGTFAAGVMRCVAPGADIFVEKSFAAGSVFENYLVRRLDDALHRGYDIFHLSITAPTRKDRPPIGIAHWLRRLRDHKGVVCVSPAGNSGSQLPSWPGAFPGVVSVGALGGDWHSRASFSNHGGWVDVYAPGRDLINAFTTGTYKCKIYPYKDKEREFWGMAKWSGTSFSAPIVTGLIAARMTETGEDGQEAAAALLKLARSQAIPGVGAILFPYGNRWNADGAEGSFPPRISMR